MKFSLINVAVAAALYVARAQDECPPQEAGRACADGGYREADIPRLCDLGWSYVDNGVTTPADADGCLSITDFPPFNAENPPKTSVGEGTDTTRWCSFKGEKAAQTGEEVGNLNYNTRQGALATYWGYCLSASNVVSDAPTVPGETTASPTTTGGSEVDPKSLGDFVADGGGAAEYIACDIPWSYKDAEGTTTNFEGCASFADFPPVEDSETANAPLNEVTDQTQWCSFKAQAAGGIPQYNVAPNSDPEVKTRAWGYCLTTANIVDATEAPTALATDEPTAPETTSAPSTDDGATEAPGATAAPIATEAPATETTEAPVAGEPTGAPVPEQTEPTTAAPTTNGTGASPEPASGLGPGEVAAAVIIPLLIVFGGLGGFAYYKYQKLNGEGGAGEGPDIGKPMPEPTNQKPVSDPEEGKKVEEIKLG